MRHVRVALALAALLLAPLAIAAPAGAAKARRLAPSEPQPTSFAAPEEEKSVIAGSCSLGAAACSDYEGRFSGVDLPALCAKVKGRWSASACPSEGTIATCMQRQIGSEDRIVARTYAPGTHDSAKKACGETPRGIFQKTK
jgi:hypothetical protein